MRKVMLASLLAALLVLGMATAAFAWTPVVGCTFDGYGNPWTHGGSVMCYREFADQQILVGSGSLDANGCFSVSIGNGPEINCYIDYTPPVGGDDPPDGVCTVPTDPNYTPEPYDCGPISTGTGPNAVALAGFGAAGMPAGTLVLALSAVLGGAAVWLRRR